MPKVNHWTMRARVGRVERERPDLGHSVIEGLYQDYFDAQEREPTLNEFRDHVDEVTSTIEWRELHDWYSPHEPTEEEKAELLDGVGRGIGAGTVTGRRRRPGRPKGTRSATRDQIVEAFRTFRETHHRRPTQVQLATNLKPPIAVRTLQDLLAEYGLPWPVE